MATATVTSATPVVLCLFNRPKRVRALIDALRDARPRTLLAIADGPRATHPDDARRCAAARAALDAIDWPCEVTTHFADHNMGCDRRIPTGLDWAFSLVDHAIVLEDDILPHPGFLGWMRAMFDRFGQDPSVGVISGWNPHVTWGDPQSDHVRSCTAGLWGWGVTASSWRRIGQQALKGQPDTAIQEVTSLHVDSVVAARWANHLTQFRLGRVSAWDVLFSLRAGLLGLHAISASRNLVRNTGFGADATRTAWTDDFRALIPTREPPTIRMDGVRQPLDMGFARAMALGLLLVACKQPAMSARLAARIARGTRLPVDDDTRLHLLPFLFAAESLQLLEHLAAHQVTSEHLGLLMQTLRAAAATRP
jgi:hypothetical protein